MRKRCMRNSTSFNIYECDIGCTAWMKWTCPPCPCPCWAPGLTDLRASYYCQCQLIWPDHQCTLGMFWGPRNFYQNTFMTHSQSWHAREREREPERAFIQVWRQTHRQRYYKVKYWLLAWANNCIIFGFWVSIFNLHNWFEASEEMWTVKAPINTVTLSHIGQGPGPGRSSSECVRSQLYFLRMAFNETYFTGHWSTLGRCSTK